MSPGSHEDLQGVQNRTILQAGLAIWSTYIGSALDYKPTTVQLHCTSVCFNIPLSLHASLTLCSSLSLSPIPSYYHPADPVILLKRHHDTSSSTASEGLANIKCSSNSTSQYLTHSSLPSPSSLIFVISGLLGSLGLLAAPLASMFSPLEPAVSPLDMTTDNASATIIRGGVTDETPSICDVTQTRDDGMGVGTGVSMPVLGVCSYAVDLRT